MNFLEFVQRGQAAQEGVAPVQLGLFGGWEKPVRKGPRLKGYAAAPGSGPNGETCGTCGHCYLRGTRSGKWFSKCDLVKATGGPGTDIVRKSPACSRWVNKRSLKEEFEKLQRTHE